MLIGVDVSSDGGLPNYQALRRLGYSFCLPRIARGLTADVSAAAHVEAALNAGLIVPAGYIYLRSNEDGAAQAAFALERMRALRLPGLVIDVEPRVKPIPTDAPHLTRPVLLAAVLGAAQLGVRAAIYGGMYLQLLELPPILASTPLWVAHYGVGHPSVPRPWSRHMIWQNAGNVPLAGAVLDTNVVHDGLDELQHALAGTWECSAEELARALAEPNQPTIRRGDKGPAVKLAQMRLVAHGYKLDIDGVFGPKTHELAMAFQAAHGLTADGVVGPKTWAALLAA